MAYDNLVEEPVERSTVYQGSVLHLEVDTVKLINGKTATREVVRHNGGVAVLALSDNNDVYFVSQFRYPFEKVVMELPAGKLDGTIGASEEDHLEAAKRELLEETGLIAEEYRYLGCIYASPGFCDEILHMYIATGLQQGECCPDEDEFLNVTKLPFDTAIEMVMSGELCDGKTVAALLKAKVVLDQ